MKKLAIGVDIGGINTAFGLVDEKGGIYAESLLPTRQYPGYADYPAYVKDLCRALRVLSDSVSFDYELVGIGIALKCLGSSPACYLILAMLADVIDHVEYKHGIRTDGLTMSIYSSLMVAATPIGGAIIQALNGMLDAGTAASVNYIWIETIAYAVCAVLMIFFGVERNLKAEQQEIANRVSK